MTVVTAPARRGRDLLRRAGEHRGGGAFGTAARHGRNLARRVTGLGRMTAASAIAAWVVGWYFGWRELMLAAAAGVVALVAAYLFTLGRANLRVAISLDRQRVVVGQGAVGALEVTNEARSRLLPLRMDTPVGANVVSVEVPSLGAGEHFEEVFVVPTDHRAVIELGPARSVQGDPFGLVRRVVAWNDIIPLYVHPRTERLEGLVNGLIRDLEGRTTNDLSPSDISFHALRDYVIGDDRRHVHWRSSARLGRLVVRQFVDTRQSVLGLVLATDRTAYAGDDEFELAVSAAASIGLSALVEDQAVVCLAGPAMVPTHAPDALLDRLAAVALHGDTDDGDTDDPAANSDVPIGANGAVTAKPTRLRRPRGGPRGDAAGERRALQALETASVIAVVTGSGVTAEELRRTTSRYGRHAAVLVFRCRLDQAPSLSRSAGNVTVVDVHSLRDLRRQVLAGVVS